MDCTKFSKTALKNMLTDPAFKSVHAEIQVYLAPKPKDYTPVEGKIDHKLAHSKVSMTQYPKGYVWVREGALYKNSAVVLRDLLTKLIDSGALSDR